MPAKRPASRARLTRRAASPARYVNNSLVRGLNILAAFTPGQPSMTVSELAAALALPQSTVFRLVTTLEHLGYLVRDEETKKYRHSARMIALGLAALDSRDLRERALPHMRALSERVQETVKLAVLDGTDIVFLASVVAPGKPAVQTPVGHRMPAYCTALGKALLAFLPPEQLDALMPLIDFTPRTPRTITDPARLRAELARTRARGFASTDQEMIAGQSSIAAPVRDQHGDVVAAVNVSTLRFDLRHNTLADRLSAATIACAAAISAELGYAAGAGRRHA